MRHAMPMQWIEQAEARHVLSAALFERVPEVQWRIAARETARQVLPRLRQWFSERQPRDLAAAQLQPAFIRQPAHPGEFLSRR